MPVASHQPVLILHGGAGAMRKLEGGGEVRYREALRAACAHGAVLLKDGASALDAAVEATRYMEDLGEFNAGLGSCLTMAGRIEMDAAVMRGDDRGFGAVAGVPGVANPVDRCIGVETIYWGRAPYPRRSLLVWRTGA